MRISFGASVWLLLWLCAGTVVMGQSTAKKETEERQEWAELVKRFSDKRSFNLFASEMWTLTHGAESKTELDQIFTLLKLLHYSPTKQHLNKIGGAKGFKDKFAALLNSRDDVIAGFAATMLAIAGDLRYAPAVAKLLEKKDPPADSEKYHHPVSSRGRAAVALSLMGAREYIPKLVSMLKSPNHYDRSGAADALGQLHAKEHAKDVARLLANEEHEFDEDSAIFMLLDDESAIYALMEMGVGAEYSLEFAKVLRRDIHGEATETAAYALAKLRAREYTKDIANLLSDKYRRGDAAKALAIMGATEYIDEIALMLKDDSGLNRKDTLLALGVMRATKYLPQVATHLNDPEGYVHHDAAYALVLMEADGYASKIIPLVQHGYVKGVYLADDFHPLVAEEVEKIRKRFSDSFLKMQAQHQR